MKRRSVRGAAAGVLALGLVISAWPSVARAESLLWTLVASPLTATTGVQTTFTLTGTNEDPLAAISSSAEIGCMVVTVPSNFTVASAVVTGSNAGGGWHVDSVVGNRVTVHSDSGGDRLELLGWVRFTITATPMSGASLAWAARAYRDSGCAGSGALLGVPPIVAVTGPPVTPAPSPTASPTPKPTQTPTPKPTPRSTPRPLPLPGLPSFTPRATPRPTSNATPPPPTPAVANADQDGSSPSAAPRATNEPTGSPQPSASPAVPDAADVTGPGAGPILGGGGGAPAISVLRILADDPRLEVGLGGVDVFAGAVWAVPAATIGVPGLLLLLWVALQTAGVTAWIPAVRRLRGEEPETG